MISQKTLNNQGLFSFIQYIIRMWYSRIKIAVSKEEADKIIINWLFDAPTQRNASAQPNVLTLLNAPTQTEEN